MKVVRRKPGRPKKKSKPDGRGRKGKDAAPRPWAEIELLQEFLRGERPGFL